MLCVDFKERIFRLHKSLQVDDTLPHPDLNQEILTSSDKNMARSGIRNAVKNNHGNHQEQPQGRTQQGGGGVVVIGHKYKPQQQQQQQGSPHVVGSKYRPGNQGGFGGTGGGCSRCGGGGSSIVEARSNSGSGGGGFVVVGSTRKRRNHQSFDAESSRGRTPQGQALWSRFSREEFRRRANLLRVVGRKIPI